MRGVEAAVSLDVGIQRIETADHGGRFLPGRPGVREIKANPEAVVLLAGIGGHLLVQRGAHGRRLAHHHLLGQGRENVAPQQRGVHLDLLAGMLDLARDLLLRVLCPERGNAQNQQGEEQEQFIQSL